MVFAAWRHATPNSEATRSRKRPCGSRAQLRSPAAEFTWPPAAPNKGIHTAACSADWSSRMCRMRQPLPASRPYRTPQFSTCGLLMMPRCFAGHQTCTCSSRPLIWLREPEALPVVVEPIANRGSVRLATRTPSAAFTRTPQRSGSHNMFENLA